MERPATVQLARPGPAAYIVKQNKPKRPSGRPEKMATFPLMMASQKGENMKTLEKRYSEAIKKIGGPAKLLNLPKQVKETLKNTKELRTKVEMLELIAKNKQ